MSDYQTSDPKSRFSDRVEDYIRYRPSYPADLVGFIAEKMELGPGKEVADMGSGTGIFSRLLLDKGCVVNGVEPNVLMRMAAEESLRDYVHFNSISGSAEQSGLADKSIDLICAAQSFHWFEVEAFRAEALRIIKPGGSAALIWNQRNLEASEFHREYEALLCRHIPEYPGYNKKKANQEKIRVFFGGEHNQVCQYTHTQQMDFDAIQGRLRSASYTPKEGDEGYSALWSGLESLYERFQEDGMITFPYITLLFCGEIRP